MTRPNTPAMGAWKGASRSTLKSWMDPSAWESLTTSGERGDAPVQNDEGGEA